MIPLHVTASDGVGGAARAAARLHRALRAIDIDSRMLVLTKSTDDPNVNPLPGILGRATRALNWRLDHLPLRRYPLRNLPGSWSVNWAPYPVGGVIRRQKADVVHLHWVGAGFLPIRQIGRLNLPVVWTLHDSWAMTGGCHVPFDCMRFETGCGNCPQLASGRDDDLSRRSVRAKADAYQRVKPVIVTPSTWLAERARRSALLQGMRIEHIPNGIDTQVFKPIDRTAARAALNLPAHGRLILTGALDAADINKGYHLLKPALELLAAEADVSCALVTVGGGRGMQLPNIPVYALGHLRDDVSLALACSAADVFVIPSIQENLPNVVMEAMACGTPCVGFRIGGIPDMIAHQQNGYLAQPYEPADLAAGIRWVLADDERHAQLSAEARQHVVARYEHTAIARRYCDVYSSMLGAAT